MSDPETQRSILTTAMRGLAGRLITMQNLHTMSTEIVTQCHTHDAEYTPGLKKKRKSTHSFPLNENKGNANKYKIWNLS